MAIWLLLTLCRKNNALATLLVDNPRKYKYKARLISKEGVLFLLLNITEIEHLQAKSFS
jgi:hypothetical protein